MTNSTTEILNQALALIEANPTHWDQSHWHCGTSHCLAGFCDLITIYGDNIDLANSHHLLIYNSPFANDHPELEPLFHAENTLNYLKAAINHYSATGIILSGDEFGFDAEGYNYHGYDKDGYDSRP